MRKTEGLRILKREKEEKGCRTEEQYPKEKKWVALSGGYKGKSSAFSFR